jgi:hypothetical protein
MIIYVLLPILECMVNFGIRRIKISWDQSKIIEFKN